MIVFVTGIDTGIGKTYATGLLARYLLPRDGGIRVVTQKIAQTGCDGVSDDIAVHRRVMGTGLMTEDQRGDTCPHVFDYPASPHLAARRAGSAVDLDRISQATERLAAAFDWVVIEGVGGLAVPLNDRATVLDYVASRGYPVILVTSPVLGSINHTLLSLEVLRSRAVDVWGLIYNLGVDHDPIIAEDSRAVFADYLRRFGFEPRIVDMPRFDPVAPPQVDFSPLLPSRS
jgi:dethiobiotin synthetase